MRDDTRKISLILSVLFISTIQAHDEELLCIRVLHGIECNGTFYEKEETRVSVGSPDFFVILLVCVVLILVAGTMSGLTIGIMALDVTTLNILVKSGTPEEVRAIFFARNEPLELTIAIFRKPKPPRFSHCYKDII